MQKQDRLANAILTRITEAGPHRSCSRALRGAALAALASFLAMGSAQAGDGLTASPPTAQTRQGVVIGISLGSVQAFLGVPYAAPPVGPLRLRPPRPHAP